MINEFAEWHNLRTEALDLYEHCLAEGTQFYMTRFIERQLATHPPRLALLWSIADDLQQRLCALREHHFGIRERLLNTFQDVYRIDVAPLMPPDQLHRYHMVSPESVIAFTQSHGVELDSDEKQLLTEMIDNSRFMANQLQLDINLTTSIHRMILDWIQAMSVQVAQSDWFVDTFSDEMIQ